MRNQIIAIALAATATTGLFAGPKYGTAGCGLGAVVFGNAPTPIVQLAAATLNSTYDNQTFGITSGTSNCSDESDESAVRERQQEIFVHVNYKSLQQEMAAGKGEKLDAFASLLGCPLNQASAFGAVAREESIFAASTPENMLSAVKSALHESDLACTNI